MRTFSELGVSPATADALALTGIEAPTLVQTAAVPAIRRGHDLFVSAGPGSGVTWAWAAGLLDRLAAGTASGAVLVVAPTPVRATRLADAVAGVARTADLSVAAIGGAWRGARDADLVFGTVGDLGEAGLTDGAALTSVAAVVVDQLAGIEALGDLGAVRNLLGSLPGEVQRIVTALPVTPGIRDLRRVYLSRVPEVSGRPHSTEPPRGRGSLRYRIASEPREKAALDLILALLTEGARHVIVYRKSDDALANFGDLAELRGFGAAGRPGDSKATVWLASDPAEVEDAVSAAEDVSNAGIAALSCDLPFGPEALDRRHRHFANGAAVALPEEMPHLRAVMRDAGYKPRPWPPAREASERANALLDPIREAMATEETAVYLAALQPLFAEADAAEVAAAAVSLWKAAARGATPYQAGGEVLANQPGEAWDRLFLTCGRRDGVGPGDILGAIVGEAKVEGASVGKITVRESHALVEVRRDVAANVVRAMNGSSLRGRSVRADYDRTQAVGGPAQDDQAGGANPRMRSARRAAAGGREAKPKVGRRKPLRRGP